MKSYAGFINPLREMIFQTVNISNYQYVMEFFFFCSV